MNFQNNFRLESYSSSLEPTSVDLVVGARLRLARMMRGLSLADVLVCTGMSHATLQKIERGDIRAGVNGLRLLCDAYHIDLRELFAPDTETDALSGKADPILTLFDDLLRGGH
ncbi:MAG: helix-turn-helix transcriptional regulator [Pseudomonadota bacterium]